MKERISAFHQDKCILCGQCLYQCPVLELSIEEAKIERKNLIEGRQSRYVLSKCTSCMSCNLYCPEQANPYQLIQERWNDLYKTRGAPSIYKGVCPTQESNVWQLLNIFLSEREKKWISQWMDYVPEPRDKVLLIGNFIHLFPFIIGGSKLLDYFKPIDRIDQWEGGAYLYQSGYLDIIQKIAERTKNDFDGWGVQTVVPILDAVHNMFTQVHPKEMGIKHDQTFINFHDWLLEKINEGEIELPNQLNLTITVHDNCYSKPFGDDGWNKHREILEKCGCKILEMQHNRKDSLCCGFGAGASWVKNISIPFDIVSEGAKKFKEAEKTGAKALVSYCGGCIYTLWAMRELFGSKIDVYHSIEIVRMAMGEKINYPHDHVKRAWDIIATMTYQLLISVFQKNFFIEDITYDADLSTFRPKKYRLLRFIRMLFDIPMFRSLYAKIFRILMPIMKSR
ncbi:MAG: (Fe-S)-binding protein [Desulfobacteraceae bacterium]|nr:(Fe-S)-binding protein [Desulfobacteraceae bacterium]MBC2755071.1 (Fe-S)-binding protein [Desulfobacteraceae bacterium]